MKLRQIIQQQTDKQGYYVSYIYKALWPGYLNFRNGASTSIIAESNRVVSFIYSRIFSEVLFESFPAKYLWIGHDSERRYVSFSVYGNTHSLA